MTFLRRQYGSRTWLSLGYVALGLPVGIVTFTVAVVGLSLGFGLLPLFLSGVVVLLGTAWVVHGMATAERARARAFLGTDLPARAPLTTADANLLRRTWALVRSAGFWKELGYCLLLLPVGTIGYSLVVAVWAIGVSGLLLPAYGWALPGDEVVSWVGWTPWVEVAAGFALGVGAILLAPLLTRWWAELTEGMARSLLSPSGAELLAARVDTLTESRARVVDAADAERRRIERDLHDGAQQRLVALAMNLGMAKEKLDSDPEGARELVTRAHAEAKESITELRNVVRGVYPAVLTDRGLDAALSALAARSPVPVRLDVRLDARPDPTAEAIAYFVVSEALTNVTKHSQASHATVHVSRSGDRLHVAVVDDGRGGAVEHAGSGLTGLRDRVRAVDGTFQLASPVGVGTTISVEVPCAS